MGQILLGMGMSFSGLFFAFFKGWMMSLILLGAFPFLMIMMGIVGKAV
jgi:ABC-type transport system involved in cytochrome bd biosynthesis fused ATPase/permease subunit